MAIERKDRSFDQIFEEVSFERVPFDYVQTLKIHMVDGSVLDVSEDEIRNADNELELFKNISRDEIADVAITLDYDSIKEDVSNTVKGVLASFFDDKSEI